MPSFILNKLIRDKIKDDYARLGQKAVFKKLDTLEHQKALISKIIEETNEINIDESDDKIAGEIADLQQVISDFMILKNISSLQVEQLRQAKFDKKGGFLNGDFVDTIELADDDEWVEYYRQHPDVFPEI